MKNYSEVMKDVKVQTAYPKVVEGVPGMLSRPEAHWLYRIPQVVGEGTYVELGTFRGRSTCMIACGIRDSNLNSTITTIDTFDDGDVSRRFKKDGTIEASGPSEKNHYNRVVQSFKDRELDKYIKVVRATTLEAAEQFADLKCDFLFIDADHSYAAVKADFNAWNGKLNRGGIIAFHDAHSEDIVKVHAEITDWEEFDRVDTLAVWRRC